MSDATQIVDPRLPEIKDCLYRLSAKAIIIKDHKLLMTLEHGADWWSLPGGGVDYGETVQESLVRELAEELGLVSEGLRMDEAPLFLTTHAVVDNIPRAVLYYRVHAADDLTLQPSDVNGYGWYSAPDFKNLTLSPSIGKISGRLAALMD